MGRKGTAGRIDELADLVIVTSVFSDRLDVDIEQAIHDKLKIIYSRGWKEVTADDRVQSMA